MIWLEEYLTTDEGDSLFCNMCVNYWDKDTPQKHFDNCPVPMMVAIADDYLRVAGCAQVYEEKYVRYLEREHNQTPELSIEQIEIEMIEARKFLFKKRRALSELMKED